MWKGAGWMRDTDMRLDKKEVQSNGERCREIGTSLLLQPKCTALVAQVLREQKPW